MTQTDFRALATRLASVLRHANNEERTKDYLVKPVLQALGYDPMDPLQVAAEWVGRNLTDNKEPIDYALFARDRRDPLDGPNPENLKTAVPDVIMECKPHGTKLLGSPLGQLLRYWNLNPRVQVATLTDGEVWHWFWKKVNGPPPERPFLTMNILDLTDEGIAWLSRIQRDNYERRAIESHAEARGKVTALQNAWDRERKNPSDGLLRHFTKIAHIRVRPGEKETLLGILQQILQANAPADPRMKVPVEEAPAPQRQKRKPPKTLQVKVNGMPMSGKAGRHVYEETLQAIEKARPGTMMDLAQNPAIRFVTTDPTRFSDKEKAQKTIISVGNALTSVNRSIKSFASPSLPENRRFRPESGFRCVQPVDFS